MLSIIVQGMGLQYISASVSQMISGEPESCSPRHACNASYPVLSFHAFAVMKLKFATIMAHMFATYQMITV